MIGAAVLRGSRRGVSVGRVTINGVLTALVYLVVMAAVAAVVYLFATLVFGRGEEMAPLAPGSTPTTLPGTGDTTGDDVRRLRFQQTVRGYKMTEVDWALQRLAAEIDVLRGRVAHLEGSPLTPSYAPHGAAAHVGPGYGDGHGEPAYGDGHGASAYGDDGHGAPAYHEPPHGEPGHTEPEPAPREHDPRPTGRPAGDEERA